MPTPVDAPHDRRSGELAARKQTKRPRKQINKQTSEAGRIGAAPLGQTRTKHGRVFAAV
jgi:hypothetical protein